MGLIPEVGSGIKEAVYGIKGLNKAVKGLETVEEARNAKRTFQEGSSFARESRAEQHEIEHEAANDNYAAANDNHAVSVEDQHPMVVNGQKGGGATRGRTVTTAKKGSGSSTGSAPRAQRGGKGGNGGGKGKPSKNKGNKNASSEAHPPKNDSPSGAGRRGSFRQAKRDYGIPVSEHPTEIRINEDKNGKIQPGRRYEFGEGEHKKVIREDAAGHYHADAPSTSIGPHFHLGDDHPDVIKPEKEGHYIYGDFDKGAHDEQWKKNLVPHEIKDALMLMLKSFSLKKT